jgi:predicted GNAT family acetyltransferase
MDDRIEVSDVPARSRFEISVGGEPAGFVRYRTEPGRVVLEHTEIDDAHQGQGVAGKLARGTLDAVRARGQRVTAECEYMAGFIAKHDEYADLVAQP